MGLSLVLLFLAGPAFGQIERSKKVDRAYAAKTEVKLMNRNGPLTVRASADGQVHVHAELVVKAKSDEAAEAVFSYFEVEADEFGDRVEISTSMGPSVQRINRNITSWIKFGDGPKIKGVLDFKISTVLEVPENLAKLELENKYDDINILEEFAGDLTVNLYSGELDAKDVSGRLDLDMKYSEARIGKAGECHLDIYDSNLWLGELASAEIKSKYSEFEIAGVTGKLEIEAYDDKWEVGHVEGLLKLKDKYSEFEFVSLGDAELSIYDGALQAETAGEVEVELSKYSEYRIGEMKSLEFDESYDDDVRVKIIESLSAKRSKYTEYRAGKLASAFSIEDSHDDKVELDWVSAKFKKIYLDGKYTEMDLHIEEGAQFEVDVDMKYGGFDFDEKRMDVRVWKEKDSELTIQGFVGGEPAVPQNFFTVKGYDNDIDWD